MAAVLITAMVLSLAACGSKVKKMTAEEFTSKLEKENFTVKETKGSEDVKTSIVAYNSDMSVMLTYSLFASTEAAKKNFDYFKETAEAAKKEGTIEKLSTSSSKITADGGEDGYIVVAYAEDMVIMVTALTTNSDAAKDACKVLGI